ncbi:MAG: hypothetical protein ACOYKN_16050 [Pirellula sp.]
MNEADNSRQELVTVAKNICRAAITSQIPTRLFGAIGFWHVSEAVRDLEIFNAHRSLDIDFIAKCADPEKIIGIFKNHDFVHQSTDFVSDHYFLSFLREVPRCTAHVYCISKYLRIRHSLVIDWSDTFDEFCLGCTGLLLTKLAINNMRDDDMRDCCMLLVAAGSGGIVINPDQIAIQCRAGWLSWRLMEEVNRNLQRLDDYVRNSLHLEEYNDTVVSIINLLQESINSQKPSEIWRFCSLIDRLFIHRRLNTVFESEVL